MTEAVDSVMINIGAFFAIAGGIIMMLFVVGMVGYLVALLWISACNKWRAICRAESLIFEYRKNRKDFLRWMSKVDTIAAEKKAADVCPVVRGRWEPGNPICPICGESKFKGLDADIWADWNRRPAPPIGRCGECANACNPGDNIVTCGIFDRDMMPDDFCSQFEPKGGE